MTPAGVELFRDALSAWAAGVTLVTIADGRDDVGATVSAFCPVSLDPPLVLVSLLADSYPAVRDRHQRDPRRPRGKRITEKLNAGGSHYGPFRIS